MNKFNFTNTLTKERNTKSNKKKKKKSKMFTKKNILIFFIPIILSINIYLVNKNPIILELNKKIKKLEAKIEFLKKETVKKKISVAFMYEHIYINGIGRFITVLAELLVKTGKYDVYIINHDSNEYDYNYNKKIKREIIGKNYEDIKDFDEANDIQIYIVNNEISDLIDLLHSFGKKVIGIYHGVYISCAFQNETELYRSWNLFTRLDSFVHKIPDDYWIYKKLGFNNTIYIPNVISFDSKNTPSSPLTYKNILMAGRFDDMLKGGDYGLYAMAEIIKEVPDATLTILGLSFPEYLQNLTINLNLENNVYFIEFSKNITEFYLNTSVLLVPSVSEAYPMVINEGKAHGLPVVAFNIDYSPCYQHDVIKVEMFDYKAMAKEVIKLLNNYDYRKRKGKEAKLSLEKYERNEEKVELWEKLFQSLLNGTEEYNKLQSEVEAKYYNEGMAKVHLEKHYAYAQQFNKYFKCHSFEKFTSLEYINNIITCKL